MLDDWSDVEATSTDRPVIVNPAKVRCILPECKAEYIARRDGRNKYCPTHRAHSKHAAEIKARRSRTFRVFDGEETSSVNHVYGLVGVGDCSTSWPVTPHWYEVLSWLYGQNDKRYINIAFHMSYDLSQIFKSLSPHEAFRLLIVKRTRNNDNPWQYPVEVKAPDGSWWLIDISHNGRLLRFKPRCGCPAPPAECKTHATEHDWMYFCDVGEYFTGSLTDIMDDDSTLGSQADRELVFTGKANRGNEVSLDKLATYNAAENRIVAEAMERTRAALRTAGVELAVSEWYGIGKAGQKWVDKYCSLTPGKRSKLSRDLINASRYSYFGPWFEDLAHGYIAGEVHEYDLNGAFGAILARMPCMEHGWTHGHGEPGPVEPGHIRQVKARMTGKRPNRLGPALHREKTGLVHSPYESVGWHWDFELAARAKLGLIDSSDIQEWWDKAPCYCPPPCEAVSQLYKLRMDYPKGSIEHNLFKKLPDTVYGKLAESGEHSKYGNPVYASYVTARCREMVLKAIDTHQDKVSGLLKVTSDGFLMRNAHSRPELLPMGTGLGEWKHKPHHEVFSFAPSLWWSAETVRSSGISAPDFDYFRMHAEHVFRSWDKGSLGPFPAPDLEIPIAFRVTTLRETVHIYNRIPDAEPYHTQCMLCPGCAGRDTSNAEVYRPRTITFGACPMCKKMCALETDHCRRHGFVRGPLCHICNMKLAEHEVMASWNQAGEIKTGTMQRRTFDPSFKRDCEYAGIFYDAKNRAFMTLPRPKGVRLESAPYRKDMGWSEAIHDAAFGYSMDGPNLTTIRRKIGG